MTDEIRAMVYALVVRVHDLRARGDEHQAEEWIHKAYEFSRRSHGRHPALGLVAPLERMLQAPDAFLPAWEPLLDDEDPWVRALARLQLGKMRIMLGHGGRDADAYLETALAEFRALGERLGISFALTELADRIAMRGEFAAACEHYEQAVAVVTEVGAVEDVIRMRSRQAQLYWLLGRRGRRARPPWPTAQRSAERVTWPEALAELALAKAELARWSGDAEEAQRQLGVATTMLGDDAERAEHPRDDTGPARLPRRGSRRGTYHRVAAFQAATEAGHALADRPGARRRRGPGAAPRPVRAGRAAARGERQRARPAGSLPARIWPGSSRKRGVASANGVRRGDAGGATRRAGRELVAVTLAS